MAAPTCYNAFRICIIRVAAVDAAGTPIAGASNGYISDATIELGVSVEIEEGDEFTQKNGCGAVCFDFADCDKIKGHELDLELCTKDFELISLLTGASIIDSTQVPGETLGIADRPLSAPCPNGVVFEAYSLAYDNNVPATGIPAFTNAAAVAFFHFVYPRVTFTPGDITLANDVVTVPLTGVSRPNTGIATDGPYNDWDVNVGAAIAAGSPSACFFDETLPTAVCGFSAVPVQ